VSLGALIPLLPVEVVEQRFDPAALYAMVAAAFRDARVRLLVLLVDDMHRLDPASDAAGQLFDANVVFLIGTVRTGDSGAAAMSELWRRDHVLRIDLENLPRRHRHVAAPRAGRSKPPQGGAAGRVRSSICCSCASSCSVRTRPGGWSRNRGSGGCAALPNTASPSSSTSVSPRCPDARPSVCSLREPLACPLTDLVGQQPLDEPDRAAAARRPGGRRYTSRSHIRLQRGERPHHRRGADCCSSTPTASRPVLAGWTRSPQRPPRRGGRRRSRAALAAARLARHGHDYPQVERLARAALVEQVSPEALLLRRALHELGARMPKPCSCATKPIAGGETDRMTRRDPRPQPDGSRSPTRHSQPTERPVRHQ
jgi:hypothetical protein